MSKKHFRLLFLLFLSAGIFYACLDEISSWRTERLPPEVVEAKAWFELANGGEFIPWQVGGKDNWLIPDWQRAIWNSDSIYKVTEIRVEGERKFRKVSYEISERLRETNDTRYVVSEMRLIVRTNKETGDKVGFIMMVHPDLEYLEKNLNNPLGKFTYLKRDKDFTGAVFYYDLTGKYVNGVVYKDGQIFPLYSKSMLADMPQLRSSIGPTEYCMQYEDWVSYDLLIDGEKFTVDEGWGKPYFDYSDCYFKDNNNNNGNTDPGFNPGAIGPGGGGPGTSQPSPSDPCRDGANGRNANTTFLNNSTIKSRVDDVLKGRLTGYESAISIGRDASGNFTFSALQVGTTTGSLPAPLRPAGDWVSYAHTHGAGYGTPSPADVYRFIDYALANPAMNSWYIYGTHGGQTEVYAINIYDRNAARAFLNKFPMSQNLQGDSYIGAMGENHETARQLWNRNSQYNGVNPHDFGHGNAAIMAYLMHEFNMGVTMSRKVGNNPFQTINAQGQKNSQGVTQMQIRHCP
jgi:hypothetical protein